jgi:hypothetical protein
MDKGHVGFRELFVVSLLMLGLVAGVVLLSGGRDSYQNLSEAKPAAVPGAESPGMGAQASGGGEGSSVPDAPAYPVVYKDVGTLLDEGVSRADSRFYKDDPDGDYDIDTFRWAMGTFDDAPDSIPLKKDDFRASLIRFDGRYDDGLRGFAFKTFQKKLLESPPTIYGTALFLSELDPFDAYAASGTAFSIQYDPHPERSQILDGCIVISTSVMRTESGAVFKTHDISCSIMYGANP